MRTLRVLAILTKRQMDDDGAYLVAALVISAGLILAAMIFAFFTNSLYLPVPTIYLLATLFVLLSIASYLFGVKQVQADQESGISAILSSLPVGGGQIVLARVATAVSFLFVVLVFTTFVVAAAVFFDLLPGRGWIRLRASEWSYAFLTDMLTYTLGSVFLIALTCYFFGLRRARIAPTLLTSLDGLPLILALILLVIIKGFTLLSIVLSVVLLVGLLMSLLAQPDRRVLHITATALIECILLSVPLFCSRYLCDFVLTAYAAGSDRRVEIKPSGLLSWEIERKKPSVAWASIHEEHSLRVGSYRSIGLPNLLTTLGIVDSTQARWLKRLTCHRPSARYWQPTYFDTALGQIVDISRGRTFYAGPEGTALERDVALGRFVSPLLGDGILYDRGSRRFYAIDTEGETVRRGEELTDRAWDPIRIFSNPYGPRMCSVSLDSAPAPHRGYYRDYVGVLDRSGRIALLDQSTLRLLGWVAHLPRPHTLFGRGSGRPTDILDCDVAVIAGSPNGGYVGMVVGSLSRQGTALTLAVFDKDGKEIRTAYSRMDLFESTLTIGKYLLESLHPPVLTLASFFTAYNFDAAATHRALFLMPNSFVALQRDRETSFGFQLLAAVLFLLPALAFAGFLSWRVVRDAALMGLSRRARGLWGLGILAFGLPAYVTCRLVRCKGALTLCQACGRGRRVDQETCHHCGSGWKEPILNPPAWRIMSP